MFLRVSKQNSPAGTGAVLFLFFFLLVSGCTKHRAADQRGDDLLEAGHWKKQTLEDIIPPWTKHAIDPLDSSFFSTLDANWHPVADTIKYPSMIARNLFSYSVAYLLSGKEQYLTIATKTKNYLLSRAWDEQYGGWYDALNRQGDPHMKGKSTFVQVYVITGLAMYYFVTQDQEVLDYVNRSNDLLEKNVWDGSRGGYYDDIARDWKVNTEVKSFASQLAPVSGYLLYMYLATNDSKYLQQAERISDVVLSHMIDPDTGWVLESFDKNWQYLPGKRGREEVNIGHNIETAWCLARLYRLNNREHYLKAATVLSDSLHRYGFNSATGFWYETIGNEDPTDHVDFTYWWIQAYGNMFDLYMAGVSKERRYVDHFLKGAAFWDRYFLDREKGDTHFSVFANGEVKDSRKANQYKAAYHNVEHGLLNHLYLGAWVNPTVLTLHFKIASAAQGDRLYPLPIESLNGHLGEVRINGEVHTPETSGDNRFITLPSLNNASVSVTLHR